MAINKDIIKFENLNLDKISGRLDREYLRSSKIDSRLNLDRILNKKLNQNHKILDKKLKDYLVMFDEGLKLVVKIHELCKEHNLKCQKGIPYLVQSAKMVSLLIGIRKMIYAGLSDNTKILNRALNETIDIMYACLINKNLSDGFSNTQEMYDNNKFYWDNFSKDKLSKECNKLFEKLSITPEYIKFLNDRRKVMKSFFSEAIHSSFNSSFSTFMMFDLNLEFDDNYFGKITSAYPKMLMDLIEEIYIFNTVFQLSIKQNISPDFEKLNMDTPSYCLYQYHYEKYNFLYANNYESLVKQSVLYSNFINEMVREVQDSNSD